MYVGKSKMKQKSKSNKRWLVYLLVATLLITTLVTALEQKWVTWTETWVENGQTNTYNYKRLAPQPCQTYNLACLKLQEDGLWTP